MESFVLFSASLLSALPGIGLVEVKCHQKTARQTGIYLHIPSPLLCAVG